MPRQSVTVSNKTTVTKKVTPVAKKVAVKAVEQAAEQVVEPTTTQTTVQSAETDKASVTATKRNRPRNQSFIDLHKGMEADLKSAYKSLQSVVRSFSSLSTAHKREVSTKIHREVTARTPTTLFDDALCNYFHSRLDKDELVISRKTGDSTETVDLSNLDNNTPVFRTDLTKLYNKVFTKHNITSPDDRRVINYENDADLVTLLTTGDYNPELEEQVNQLRNGTYELNIFRIQRFLNHHLRKVESSA